MDTVNGLFEMGGALALCLNVRQLWRDRVVSGVHWAPTLFFQSWGIWNCLYYPSLGQWLSLVGGVCVLAVNCVWLGSWLWLRRSEPTEDEWISRVFESVMREISQE